MEEPNTFGIDTLARKILKKEDGSSLSEEEALHLIAGMHALLAE